MKMRDTDLNHMLTCYHEAGHGVVAHYWGENPRGGIRAIRGTRGSCSTTIYITPDMIRSAGTDLDREWVTRAAKAAVSIYWAGLLTECKYYGFRIPRGGDRPDKLVWLGDAADPTEDVHKIKEIFKALGHNLRTKAGKAYAMSLQNETWDVISEERTWRAIQDIAGRLLEKGEVSESEADGVFEKYRVPAEWYGVE